MATKLETFHKTPTSEKCPSLAPDSEANYLMVQLRPVDTQNMRVQLTDFEDHRMVSTKLYEWLKLAEKSEAGKMRLSLAGTKAKYLPAQVRIEDPTTGEVRFRVPGPTLNRDYGACFIVTWPKLAALLDGKL